MRTLICTVVFLNFFILSSFSQSPDVEWQNTIGGSAGDFLRTIKQTADGGYIAGGNSYSGATGDKTEAAKGGSDYWVVKLNTTGNIVWQNTIGGSADDFLYDITETTDGGFVLAGYSASGSSGDKTEANIGTPGTTDYWLIKLDGSGNIVWQHTIGGNNSEVLRSVKLCSDGGFILGGYSISGISGDKSEACVGEDDYWIVKIDATGNIVWQNTIGGITNDYVAAVDVTPDGGCIVGGASYSGISGDKSEPAMGSDFWIIKLDNTGNIEWQNTITGSHFDGVSDIHYVNDGYIISGASTSLVSADKTEPCYGLNDYWIVKIDLAGNIVWQNTIGGSNFDVTTSINQVVDGGYIVAGYSISGVTAEKTAPKIGNYDFWIIKLNETGNITWQTTIGGTNIDMAQEAAETDDGGFIIGGYSESGISGTKTEASAGQEDFWIVKLEAPPCIINAEICNAIDDDCDGFIDEDIVESISIGAEGPTPLCQGESVILSALATAPGLQWMKNGVDIPGATTAALEVSTKGYYSCRIITACTTVVSNTLLVNVLKNPTAVISAGGPTTFCSGGSVILTANSGVGLSYQWYKGAILIPGATSINYTATLQGNYKCRVTKTATGCYKNSNSISVTVNCKLASENVPVVFPNPANETVEISYNKKANCEIRDISGKTIMQIELNTQVDISELSAGMYFVLIEDEKYNSVVLPLVIE